MKLPKLQPMHLIRRAAKPLHHLLGAMLFSFSIPALAGSSLPDFQANISDMLSIRAEAYQFAELHQIIGSSATPKLNRQQSEQLRNIIQRYMSSRARLMPEVERVSPCFSLIAPIRLNIQKPSDTGLPELCTASKGRMWSPSLNPYDAAGKQLIGEIARGLAAALVLMDSYQIAIEPYAQNAELRYLMNYDMQNKVQIDQLIHQYRSADVHSQLLLATDLIDQYFKIQREGGSTPDALEQYLYTLSQSTVWYVNQRKNTWTNPLQVTQFVLEDFNQQKKVALNTLSFGLSFGFGQMVGLVQTRSGKLRQLDKSELAQLESEMKPLDILLEKTPFRLTDKMIPGYYGHMAVWLGSEAELKEIGAWETIPSQWQEQVRKGKRIVEALRSGVTLSTLDHFMNIDDLLVLRDQRPLNPEYLRNAALTAVQQLGKEYDFNFDVMTHERIVCSELAYVVFPDIDWPLAQTLGRYTISPDNVAQLAVGESPVFSPVIMYRDGKREADQLQEKLQALIARN
ncbi:YiiX/YebB-like N1pC/P60 family cysteine hydrolase [Janthinobacterium sp. B9-8]|uniref:YiiX/YebB-like N1pC/P60 family cysteine hydrolase n=1 Tax=Janthinobacterium sp. B9-8 TaxID=1236179 RepID=UPI0009E78A2A|nr:YiiX/YebB-like N1pC/P60 family cysteine hydrolase [Janthinobacterium sp. B9-8]